MDLLRSSVLAALSDSALRSVAGIAGRRTFCAGQTVFAVGDPATFLGLVVCGHGRTVRTSAAGRKITLLTFGPRDTFGELALFPVRGRPPTMDATMEAIDDLHVLTFPGDRLHSILRDQNDFWMRLARVYIGRAMDFNNRLEQRSFQTTHGRVAAVLCRLVGESRLEGAGERDVVLRTTQAEIGHLADSARNSTNRSLAVLEREQVISLGRGRIVVHDPDALERYIY